MHERLEVVAGGVTDARGWQVKPEGRLVTARLTVPANPFNPVTVIVCTPATPVLVLTVTGEAGPTVKSTMWKVTELEVLDKPPPTPVTETV